MKALRAAGFRRRRHSVGAKKSMKVPPTTRKKGRVGTFLYDKQTTFFNLLFTLLSNIFYLLMKKWLLIAP